MAVKKKAAKKKVVKKKPAARAAGGRKKNSKGLTNKQQSFADHYIMLGDATAAYEAASTRKIKHSTARSNGHVMLQVPAVKAYLDARSADLQDEMNYTQKEWFADAIKLKEMAMGERDVPIVAVVEGAVIPLGHAKRVDLPSARATMDMLGKSRPINIFDNKVEIGLEDPLTQVLNAIAPTLGPPSKRK